MKIPQDIQRIINEEKTISFGTADNSGNPNINLIAIKRIEDDETISLADNYFNKTLRNLNENKKSNHPYQKRRRKMVSIKRNL